LRRLIVNADDFGMAESVNLGIIKGHREGIITSTSLLACGKAAGHAASLAKENPTLGVGVHLCLTIERPVSMPEYIPSLAGGGRLPSGTLPFALGLFSGSIKTADIETELRAQIERAMQLGIRPTHIDGHQHIIMLGPVFKIVLRLAKEYGIGAVRYPVGPWDGLYCPLRTMEKIILEGMAKSQSQRLDESGLKHPDHFFGLPETGRLDTARLSAIIESLPEGTNEIMCHPGLPNPSLAKEINWGKGWDTELAAVTDARVKELIKSKGVELISFGQL
jgi:predicted glycoside hydrolase/deacetylase ChbG (UPF0249 family)